MKILWFISGLVATEDNVTSTFASTRRRCLEVLRGFGRVGVKADIELIQVNPGLKLDSAVFENASIAIVGKMIFDFSAISDHLKHANIPVVCDAVDLYDDEAIRQKALQWSDYITFSTNSFYRSLPDVGGLPSFKIPDIQEGVVQKIGLPGVEVETLKVMWYGAEREWPFLRGSIKQLAMLHEYRVEVLVLSSGVSSDAVDSLKNDLPANVALEQLPWGFDLYEQRLSSVDFVLVPYPPSETVGELVGDPLVSALWNGKMPLACSAWAEHPFHEYIGITEDACDGLRVFMTRLNTVANLIDKAQGLIDQKHSLKTGTLKWIEVIEAVTQAPLLDEGDTPQQTNSQVKLKMGGLPNQGDDYVCIGEEGGNEADVFCNLKTLDKFETDSADEILSVDHIDQFYQWEVGDVLKSWARVLKPGGALVIECADFSMACEQFLKESSSGSTANTLKMIYGDPARRNPKIHPKWGYTPDSLKKLMLASGLEGVVLQADPGASSVAANRIRMVGTKPQA